MGAVDAEVVLAVAAGGDGTVRIVVDGLAGSGVAMGIVAAGTANLLARNQGLPLAELAALEVALVRHTRAIDSDHPSDRQGIAVAKCTVERLMRAHGWQGVRRLKRIRTTVSDPAADRAPDLVKHGFRAPASGRLLVADFTYVRLAGGTFAYIAFLIDAFAVAVTPVGFAVSLSPPPSPSGRNQQGPPATVLPLSS